jgi:hypothetical protein
MYMSHIRIEINITVYAGLALLPEHVLYQLIRLHFEATMEKKRNKNGILREMNDHVKKSVQALICIIRMYPNMYISLVYLFLY